MGQGKTVGTRRLDVPPFRKTMPPHILVPRPSRLPLGSLLLVMLPACGGTADSAGSPEEAARWEARAANVTITRDDWGIPHIHGPTDADAIFGLMYAQAEDDFPRIETNFLNSQGLLAEAEGEEAIWRDLRMRLFIDPEEMQALYAESPEWLRDLMDAWADGLNYFLHTHPEVRPRVLHRFEPWMALTFSEGSIGGDIERVNMGTLRTFYEEVEPLGAPAVATTSGASPWEDGSPGNPRTSTHLALSAPAGSLVTPDPWDEPRGSNGIAIAPRHTAGGNALLLINPHTSFYFRHEAKVSSDEGLNVYGALTWGQFFVYQGFNEHAGWMHTSSSVDNIDEFLETVVERDGELYYLYGDEERPLTTRETTIRYRTEDGATGERTFTVYRTHRGPIVRAVDGRWVSVALMEEPMRALMQSYLRTKTRNLDEYLEVMRSHTNSSNNTLFADREGNIAYLHSNFVPVRDTRFDYSRPVDGSNPATDWQGLHTIEESPNSINPGVGWAMCTNNWPYSAAGPDSPRQADFPSYMDRGSENARGVNALELLPEIRNLTLEGLRDLAYSTRVPAFDPMIPRLVSAWDGLPADSELRERTAEAVELLRGWDRRWGVESVATSVAIFWATGLQGGANAPAEVQLQALADALDRLEEDFDDWRTPWGEINRFQRLTGEVRSAFDDDAPSLPVGFTSARWGSLASFGAGPRDGTKRWYGTSGNSFVAVVEFGERVRALAVTAGGLNNDPASPHFSDQAERYAAGDLRPVYFYADELAPVAQRTYRPGER